MIKIKMAPKRREIFINSPKGVVRIFGPVSMEEIESSSMDKTLSCFRQPESQKKALMGIASLAEGQVFIACFKNTIVGYVTFHPPEKFERWGQGDINCLLELGAIEVSRYFRGMKLAISLMELAFQDDAMEDYIVIATEYYWHWDLEGTGLPIWKYRGILEIVMNSVGMKPQETNDPEISSHPANVLMVRVGKNVSDKDIQAFDELRNQTDDNGDYIL
jgi:acetoin utilization protein AcuA